MERRTFLHACKSGDLEGVKYFVSQGADVRANNWAVRFASTRGHLEVVKYLVSQGVDVQGDNYYAVKCAANCGHLEVIKYLVSQGADVTAHNNWAVREASRNGHLEVVKYLVSQGAPTTDISERALQYLSFCKRMEENKRIRAQKKIYFWWIQICYDLEHPSGCGKRMADRNLALYESMVNTN
jgi:ankyrin repeat protein